MPDFSHKDALFCARFQARAQPTPFHPHPLWILFFINLFHDALYHHCPPTCVCKWMAMLCGDNHHTVHALPSRLEGMVHFDDSVHGGKILYENTIVGLWRQPILSLVLQGFTLRPKFSFCVGPQSARSVVRWFAPQGDAAACGAASPVPLVCGNNKKFIRIDDTPCLKRPASCIFRVIIFLPQKTMPALRFENEITHTVCRKIKLLEI